MLVDLTSQLQEFSIPFGVEDARAFLRQVCSVIDYLVVYQHYFPTEYEQSMRLVHSGQSPLFPAPGHAYSEHEVVLLKLVDKQCFPLPLDYMLDEADEENRCYTIPIDPFGIDLSSGDDVVDMDLGWQLMHYLIGEIKSNFFFDGASDDDLREIFSMWIEPGKVDNSVLHDVCGREREPLAFLCCAIDMLDYSTGTAWLDSTLDMPCEDADWSIEIIDELVKQYGIAMDIKDKAEQLMNWLEGENVSNFKEVIRLWNACVIQTKQKQQEKTT